MDEVSCEADFRAFRTCVNTYRMCECEHRDEFCFIFTLFCWFFWCMGIFYLLYGGQLLRVHGTLSGYTQTNTRITNTYNIKRLYAEKGGIVRFHFFFFTFRFLLQCRGGFIVLMLRAQASEAVQYGKKVENLQFFNEHSTFICITYVE